MMPDRMLLMCLGTDWAQLSARAHEDNRLLLPKEPAGSQTVSRIVPLQLRLGKTGFRIRCARSM
jgi:hypothetical protein